MIIITLLLLGIGMVHQAARYMSTTQIKGAGLACNIQGNSTCVDLLPVDFTCAQLPCGIPGNFTFFYLENPYYCIFYTNPICPRTTSRIGSFLWVFGPKDEGSHFSYNLDSSTWGVERDPIVAYRCDLLANFDGGSDAIPQGSNVMIEYNEPSDSMAVIDEDIDEDDIIDLGSIFVDDTPIAGYARANVSWFPLGFENNMCSNLSRDGVPLNLSQIYLDFPYTCTLYRHACGTEDELWLSGAPSFNTTTDLERLGGDTSFSSYTCTKQVDFASSGGASEGDSPTSAVAPALEEDAVDVTTRH